MKTTDGREIRQMEIKIDDDGWSWEVQDGDDQDRLSSKDIGHINNALTELGVKVNPLVLAFPNAQNLCG